MPKMKTKSGAKKRFRVTGSGKIRMNAAFRRHMMSNKTRKMKRQSKGTTIMAEQDAKLVRVYMPYHR